MEITENNLPIGLWWEKDLSCWEAVKCDAVKFGCVWRWQPMNWQAFDKLKPEGKMVNYYPLVGVLK